MAYPGRASNPSNSMNLDVDEIASILRQVQSGQLSLQQQLSQQNNGRNTGPDISTNYPAQGPTTGQYEEDSGLSLLQTSNIGSNSNFGRFSQPLRRPGRSQTGTAQQEDTTLSKSAIQKQIFAARMLGAPLGVTEKLAGQTSPTSSIKPNLAASRMSGSGSGTKGKLFIQSLKKKIESFVYSTCMYFYLFYQQGQIAWFEMKLLRYFS